MFTKFVLKVLASGAARSIIGRYTQNMVETEVRYLLEDPRSNTRVAMMRIIRGEVKDVIEEAREEAQNKAELDEVYVQWAQERRQALLAAQNADLSKVPAGQVAPEPVDPLAEFPVGQPVRVVRDALFENRIGRVTGTRESSGFPEVLVELEGHNMSISFTPDALRPVFETEQPPADAAPAGAPTELLPAVDQ